jgi:hypothetical protein
MKNFSNDKYVTSDYIFLSLTNCTQSTSQPYDERLHQLSKAGFKLATGILVDTHGFRGIIIFYANPHSDRKKLCHYNNSQLIKRAAQYIGAAVALQEPIKVAARLKNNRPVNNWRRLRVKILAVLRFQRPLIVRRNRPSLSTFKRVGSFVLTLERMKSMRSFNREHSFQLLSEAAVEIKKNVATAVVDAQYAAKAKQMKWLAKLKGGNARYLCKFSLYCCSSCTGANCTECFINLLLSYLL